jgi:hypothetical protein
VVQASLLIFCTSPASRVDELEDWLIKSVAAVDRDQVALYAARDERGPNGLAGTWVVAASRTACMGARMSELVAEMRLLGLNPILFRPGSLPSVAERLAHVF